MPPPSGLARSIRRLFDAPGEGSDEEARGEGSGEKAAGEGSSETPPGEASHQTPPGERSADDSPGVEAPAPPVRARERLTNRLARYLRAEASEREALEEPIQEDVRTFLEAGDPGPLADAAVALSTDDSTPDVLLKILLTPEVAAELADRGVAIRPPGQSTAESGSVTGSRSDSRPAS